jgi:hypothetical protein
VPQTVPIDELCGAPYRGLKIDHQSVKAQGAAANGQWGRGPDYDGELNKIRLSLWRGQAFDCLACDGVEMCFVTTNMWHETIK